MWKKLTSAKEDKLSFVWVKFEFIKIHPGLDLGETLSKLGKGCFGVVACNSDVYLCVISIEMMLETEKVGDKVS